MSKEAEILRYLYKGHSLTGEECLFKFHTMKLSTRVSEWRKEGHEIVGVWEEHEDGRHMRYSIPTWRVNNG